jgi:hypothetical protein
VTVAGLVIVGTNARTAVAIDAVLGRPVWKRGVDGSAVFGLIRHKGAVVVVGSSIYLLSPRSGDVEQHLRWPDYPQYSVEAVEDFGTKLAAIMRNPATTGKQELVMCDLAKGTRKSVWHEVWCPILRYIRDTRTGYLSHLHGVRLLDINGETVSDLRIDEDGVGLVDVHNSVIYAATGRGNVLAIRHP